MIDYEGIMETGDVIRAFSNPLRIKIIEILSKKTETVTGIVIKTGSRQSTVSTHLSILLEIGIVDTYNIGRERIYKLLPEGIEELVNYLNNIINPRPNDITEDYNIKDFHRARVCYDHLAGIEGVKLFDGMIARKWLVIDNRNEFSLTLRGKNALISKNVDISTRKNSNRIFAYGCFDSTVKKYHLGGTLGASLLKTLEEYGYLDRINGTRKIVVKRDLEKFFGDDC